MPDTYESFIGPLHPGWYKLPTPQQQKIERELSELIAKNERSATLNVSHPTLVSAKITELLELEPDGVFEDGDTIYKSDRFHTKQTGCFWSYSLCMQGHHIRAEDLLMMLLDDLSGKLPSIRLLQEQGAKMSIKMQFDQFSDVVFLELKPELLIKLAQLRIDFHVLVRSADDGDDEMMMMMMMITTTTI